MSRGVETLYIVMPAYNEEANIEQVVSSWIENLKYGSKESRLVVADSGSTDDTHKVLLRLQKKFPQLEILEKTNQYHGPKVMALYKYAVENGADFVFQTDSDGQTDPAEFEKFWNDRHKHDAILGDRRVRGDGKGRAFIEKVVCFLLKLFFKVKVSDANAPFRLMNSGILKKYLGKIPMDYELPNIILTAYFVRYNEDVAFKEIKFSPRIAGENSINFKRIFEIGARALIDFCRFKKDMDGEGFKEKAVVAGIFAVVAGILIMISPAFPWNGGVEMTDSSVFLTVGRQMQDGAVPYVDTFDHKGPLMYIINSLGVMINQTKGIFIFEFLAMFFTLWYMFKIFRLKNSNVWFSGIMTVLLLTPFINLYFFDAGNLTEQYALPFITYALYVFLKYFLEGRVSSAKVFWVGVGLACVLMLRINMVGVWFILGLAVLVRSLFKKEFKELWRYIRWLIIGSLCVLIPIAIWLLASGAFGAFIDVYIKFNLAYTDVAQQGVLSTIVYFTTKDIVVVLALCLTGYLILAKKDNRFLGIVYAITYVFCILAACMSGRIYPHYGMVLVPLAVFPFAVFCHDLRKGENSKALLSFVILFMISITFTTWTKVADLEAGALSKKLRNAETVNLVSEVCAQVEKYTNPSDKIAVYGNWNYIYLRCNRLPISKYSYQFPIGRIKTGIMDEYFDEIARSMPKVFVVQGNGEVQPHDAGIAENFLKNHNYVERWRDSNTNTAIYTPKM